MNNSTLNTIAIIAIVGAAVWYYRKQNSKKTPVAVEEDSSKDKGGALKDKIKFRAQCEEAIQFARMTDEAKAQYVEDCINKKLATRG